MTSNLEPETLEAWRRLLFAQAKVLSALEADMLEQHDLPMSWFDVLGRLNQAPGKRLRMHELEESVLFTRSGITRLADRIEESGLIRRERSAEDRRGVYLVITEAGIAKIDEVWPDHVASIQKHFGQYLNTQDVESLRNATQKILDHK
ncbi:MAG: MarR family winged helix-turn-helix transcriptional regulator [Acidimicrobiia bacterium]